MNDTPSIRELVVMYFDRAVKENGYDELLTWETDALIVDLKDCCSDPVIEKASFEELRPCVRHWKETFPNG